MTSRARIVLIEVDPWFATRLKAMLDQENLTVDIYGDGMAALAALPVLVADAKPVVVLLDLNLPGLRGADVLRRLRRQWRWPQVAVIVLTIIDNEDDIAECLEEGADDFVSKVKKVEVEANGRIVKRLELIARIKSQIRRQEELQTPREPDNNRKYGTLLIDGERHICKWNGHTIDLSGGAFTCLWELAEDPPKPKSRDALKKAASVEHIDGHIKELRDALGEDAIENLPRIGYRLGAVFLDGEQS